MSGKVYFISGGNRGIGFEFVKQLSSTPENTIIASARDISKATELQKLADAQGNIKIVTLDVADQTSIDALGAQLKPIAKDGIDVMISNAGIAQTAAFAPETKRETYEIHYRTNALGPIFLTKALYPFLKQKETRHLVYISSDAGSIGAQHPVTTSAYGQSKAALNYSVKEISFELGAEGFVAVALHPGAVVTDMGHEAIAAFQEYQPALLEQFKAIIKQYQPEESVKFLLDNVILKLDKEKNGKFFNLLGEELVY